MSRYLIVLCLLLACAGRSGAATAAEVALIGVIGDKAAVLAIDGGDPKTVKVGQTWNGISIISVQKDRATVRIDGKERVLVQGMHYRSSAPPKSRESVTLAADTRGHFFADGMVNGLPQRFLVDTGASVVVLTAADASRLGLDYRAGPRVFMQTANGKAPAYVLRLERIDVGGIQLSSVDAVVIEQPMGTALLGMSFLNRVEMQRDGQTMTLIKRF
jgi:aspartyl protease family protein